LAGGDDVATVALIVALGASRCDAVLVDCAEREEAAVDALPLERATRFGDDEARWRPDACFGRRSEAPWSLAVSTACAASTGGAAIPTVGAIAPRGSALVCGSGGRLSPVAATTTAVATTATATIDAASHRARGWRARARVWSRVARTSCGSGIVDASAGDEGDLWRARRER
jgi:hypothetical protein